MPAEKRLQFSFVRCKWLAICPAANICHYKKRNPSVCQTLHNNTTNNADGLSGRPGIQSENNPNNCKNTLLPGLTEDCYDNTSVMQYKVYYPQPYDPQTKTGYNYSTCPLPVYINVHGGGFSDCLDNPLSLNPASDNPLCLEMSRRGFVVFDVNYRLGLKLASPSTTISAQQQLAVYRASQDVRGAIRSIIRIQKDQDDGVSGAPVTEYKINYDKIFLGGNSAGSVTVLNVAYYTQSMLNQVNPYSGANSVQTALGDIDADFYYGGTDIVYQNRIQGVLALWGNFAIPPGSYDMSDPSKAKSFFGTTRIPVICFHGEDDPVINIDIAAVKFSAPPTNTATKPYTQQNTCVLKPFKTENLPNNIDVYTYGLRAFFQYILQPLSIPSELYIDCQMGHGLDDDCQCPSNFTVDKNGNCTVACVFDSDFGTGATNTGDVIVYIAGRAAVFFQNILGNNAQARQDVKTTTPCSPCGPSTNKIFVDCRNDHNKCDLLNNDQSCSQNPVCPGSGN